MGYEGVSLERFLRALLVQDIRLLSDVRRNTLSMKFGFSKGRLSRSCEALGIQYVHMPELGIASSERRNLDGPAAYEKLFDEYEKTTLRSADNSLNSIRDLVSIHKRIVLVCFEGCRGECHRSRLAAALQRLDGWRTPIKHIAA